MKIPQIRVPKSYVNAIGNERVEFPKEPLSGIERTRLYSFYNTVCDNNDAKEFTLFYFKNIKKKPDIAKKIAKLDKAVFPQTIGWLCRLETLGATLSEDTILWRATYLKELCDKLIPTKKTKSNLVPAYTASDRMAELIGDIEEMIDQFITGGFPTTKSVKPWLSSKNVKGPAATKIIAYYRPILEDLYTTIHSPSKEQKEAFSCYKKNELKKLYGFIEDIIKSSETFQVSGTIKKPRKRKVKSPEQIVSKLKFLAMDEATGAKSEDPAKIIGASQLWVYNAKTRKLGVYVTNSPDGLSIKGSSVINFDETKAIQKTLRKPKEVLDTTVNAGKVSLRYIMDNIKAKPGAISGRINKDVILLRIIK